MKLYFKMSDKEKELLALFKKHGSLSTSDNFKGWGGSDEWKTLREHHLIYHSNHTAAGDYIRYSLTELGELACKNNKIK